MAIRWTAEERAEREAYRRRERESRAPKVKLDKAPVKLGGEEVVIGKRPKVSYAQKVRVHEANEGRCWVCGRELPIEGPEVQYDHVTERALTGRDDDDALAPICTVPCHAEKTAKFLTTFAHVKRMEAKFRGKKKPKRKIESAGFSGDYAPLPARIDPWGKRRRNSSEVLAGERRGK
jgi:hypothetical protein